MFTRKRTTSKTKRDMNMERSCSYLNGKLFHARWTRSIGRSVVHRDANGFTIVVKSLKL